MLCDFHIHSKYSFDSISRPRDILKRAEMMGLDVISITDHNTIKGSIEAKKNSKEYGIEVILGIEVNTNIGDVIGIGIEREIESREWEEVIISIHDQGGIAILPHPYRSHKNLDELARAVDYIEIFNSRNTKSDNDAAIILAQTHGKKIIAGSDAHTLREIGNVINSVYNTNCPDGQIIKSQYCDRFDILWSIGIKRMKKYRDQFLDSIMG